jgi:nucleoside-diphosphate-sugar epimerase
MRVAISGGTGYIGEILAERLTKQGNKVAILTKKGGKSARDGFDFCEYDGQVDSLAKFFKNWHPDAIVHLAADVNKVVSLDTIDSLVNANIVLAAHIAEAAKFADVKKIINISTYSTSVDGETYYPQTFYAATKKAAEDIFEYYRQSVEIDIRTLCFYDIYGPNQPHVRFIPSLMNAIRSGVQFSMTQGEQEICLLYVEDAVSAIIFELTRSVPLNRKIATIYSVYGDEVFKLKDLPRLISGLMGVECPQILNDKPYRFNEIMKFHPLYERLPAWKPKFSLAKGIKKILVSEQKN